MVFNHDGEKDVDICITHAFFPRINAQKKANDDGIPLLVASDVVVRTDATLQRYFMTDIVKWLSVCVSVDLKSKL